MTESAGFFENSKRGRGIAKHSILKYYLGGYFGALGQSGYKRVVFIDGFAGPGQYTNKDGTIEDGSPLVAYKTAVEHRYYDNFNEILLIFIEADEENHKQLKNNLTKIQNNFSDRDKVKLIVIFGSFEEVMQQFLYNDDYVNDPFLIFVDPFGIKGIPMELMKALADRPRTELFINVMFSSINHWYRNHKLNKLFNEFLGEDNSEWKKTVFNGDTPKSEEFVKYYVSKLTGPDIFHHIFAMKDQRNRNIYQLVFVTKYLTGLKTMKRAMDKSSQKSDLFVYSEWLEEKIKQGKEPLQMQKSEIQADVVERILEKYRGQTVSGRDIELFVWCETPYKFNLKVQLKSELAHFIVNESRKFNELYFQID